MPVTDAEKIINLEDLRAFKNKIATDLEIVSEDSSEGRTLPERFADVVNVKDYGAVGDGVTDDSAAFAAAWEKATTQKWYHTDNAWSSHAAENILYFPPGRYLITQNNFLNSPVPFSTGMPSWGCKMQGAGMFASQILFKPTVNNAALYNQTVAGSVAYCGLEINNLGIIFDDSDVDYTGVAETDKNNWFFNTVAVTNQNFQFLNFVNCLFVGTKYTVFYEDNGTYNASENRFVNCRVRTVKTLFKLNNYESLNHVLLDTDVESVYGDIIDLGKGSEITWIGGSVVFSSTVESECAIVAFEKNEQSLSGGQVSIQNIRVEFRSPKSRVVRIIGNTTTSISFSDCRFSKFDSNQNFGICSVGNLSNIAFNNCTLPSKSSGSRFEFIVNENETQSLIGGTDARSNNISTSLLTFRDCMPGDFFTTANFDYYAIYPDQYIYTDVETKAKSIHTVVYDNCKGLPNAVEYSSPYKSGRTYFSCGGITPFKSYVLPHVEDGVLVQAEDPELFLPKNAYVTEVVFVAKANADLSNSNVIYEVVDEVEYETPGTGTIYGETIPQPYKNEFFQHIVINKIFSGSISERTLRFRLKPSYVSQLSNMGTRRLDTYSLYAVVC